MRRRWGPGWQAEFYGLQFRVVEGGKKGRALPGEEPADDLRLEWLVGGHWIAVGMVVGFLLADFFYENEDALYPPEHGFKGGKKYLEGERMATKHGWQATQRWLEFERDHTLTLFDEVRQP